MPIPSRARIIKIGAQVSMTAAVPIAIVTNPLALWAGLVSAVRFVRFLIFFLCFLTMMNIWMFPNIFKHTTGMKTNNPTAGKKNKKNV